MEESYVSNQPETTEQTINIAYTIAREDGNTFQINQLSSIDIANHISANVEIKLTEGGQTVPHKFFYNLNSELTSQLELSENLQLSDGTSYTLELTPINDKVIAQNTDSEGKVTKYVLNSPTSGFVNFTKDIAVSQDAIEAAEKTSEIAGSVTSTASTVGNAMSLLAIILAADQSGATLKFSQISKLISRLRMLDINYGSVFGSFLDTLGKAFDGENQGDSEEERRAAYMKRRELISLIGNGRKGKFDVYGQKMFLFGTIRSNWESELIYEYKKYEMKQAKHSSYRMLEITEVADPASKKSKISIGNLLQEAKYWVYMISWIIKLFILNIIANMKSKRLISVKTLKTIKKINLHRKIHFLLFNLVAIDIAFTGTRSLLHLKINKALAYHIFLAGITYLLCIIDTLEIFLVTINIIYREDRKRKLEELRKLEAEKKAEEGKNAVDTSANQSLVLQHHEKSKESFSAKKVKGFGLREYFWETDMIEAVMTKDQATKLGYVRVIDYQRSKNVLLSNLAVEDHATAELKKDNPQIYSSKAILLANFSFLLRIIGYHLILVALPNNPAL